MTHEQVFGNAEWIQVQEGVLPFFRSDFYTKKQRTEITILGFGTFEAYLNGKKIGDDYFTPLNSEFEKRALPEGEELSGYHCYPLKYDITDLLSNGKNALCILVGAGWYCGHRHRKDGKNGTPYGKKKLCFKIDFEDGSSFVSNRQNVKWRKSFITESNIHFGEKQDFADFNSEYFLPSFDCGNWENTISARPPITDYEFTNCPTDKLISVIEPELVVKTDNYSIYDAKENLTGFVVLRVTGKNPITLTHSESMTHDDLDAHRIHKQICTFTNATLDSTVHQTLSFCGFRYFKVEGDGQPIAVHKIHANVKISSSFECDNKVLNWLYGSYIRTQLANIHYGTPSDCPHIEKRGYTGDGQLLCHTVMMTLDAKSLYEKWIRDIFDGQDSISGHVQYTAPATVAGGGPGGWGCAIAVVPYEYYKAYGDDSLLKEAYPKILKYLSFLDEHSINNLVVSDTPDSWCLGDWCALRKTSIDCKFDFLGAPEPNNYGMSAIPAPYVNNYFYVVAAQIALKAADLLDKHSDKKNIENKIALRKRAMNSAYFNTFDDCYMGNIQGANAFALKIGLGTKKTLERLISYYEKQPYFDSGIFATELISETLFEAGRADIAVNLLTASRPAGFGAMMDYGATTLWEEWTNARSLSHPMFGAVVAHLFEYLLGIRQTEDSTAYDKVIVSPVLTDKINDIKGSIGTVKGEIGVKITKTANRISYSVTIPLNVRATLILPNGNEISLNVGKNDYDFFC